MAVILFKVICCTITKLTDLLSWLLCKLTTCLLVITIKALKVPGVALLYAIEQIGGLIRCCVEQLLVSILKNVLNAIQKVVALLFKLLVDGVSRSVASAMKNAGRGLVKKMKLMLIELMVGFSKMILETMKTTIGLFFNFVVDVTSWLASAAVELLKKTTWVSHELWKLLVSFWKILLDISENVVLFYNFIMLEVVPRLLEVAGELIDQMTLAFNRFMELIKSVEEIMRDYIKRISPVVWELIKKTVGLLQDYVVERVKEHVKEAVFAFVFGSVVMSEYHQLIVLIYERVMSNVVEMFTAMVMYFLRKKLESIKTILRR